MSRTLAIPMAITTNSIRYGSNSPFCSVGLAFPEVRTACELGFGQGLSTNIHAAASLVEWHGTDFNPAEAAFAQETAVASGSNAKLYYQAFADFCNRSNLPDFDFIGLHGIWSWINDQNRSIIVDFVKRKLRELVVSCTLVITRCQVGQHSPPCAT